MPESKPALVGMPFDELVTALSAWETPQLRAKQIWRHIYTRRVVRFEDMRDLPTSLRAQLSQMYRVSSLEVAEQQASTDGVHKLLLHGGDEQVFECVLLPYEDRVSCCISTQVGCPMGCTFCATGLGGFDRNLTVGEIVGQVLLLQQLTRRRISHVVFMGMGEPLLNFENLASSIRYLHEDLGISHRHITVSTVGIVPQVERLARLRLPIHLAISLHSPSDKVRERLMPVNRRWPVDELMRAVRRYFEATKRKVTFEYLLIDGINDTRDQARDLAALVSHLPCVVNLIPFNYVDTVQGFRRPSSERMRAFRRELESRGVNVTQRVERGHDIAAACGQLAGVHTGRFAKRSTSSAIPVIS